ncbi:MAG: ATP-binding protein, partial [Verrucomicrobiales bacterium]|nr:ATP-binding protein [Verrucomicrobiales bacterium]
MAGSWGERVRQRWSGCTIRTRVVLTCAVLLMSAFVIASVTILNLRARALKVDLVDRLRVDASVMALRVLPALQSGNRADATVMLRAFTGNRSMRGVIVADDGGNEFAKFGTTEGLLEEESVLSRGQFSVWDSWLVVEAPVELDQQRFGTVRMLWSLNVLHGEMLREIYTYVMVNLVVLAMAIWALVRVVELAMEPVSKLSKTAKNVAEKGDYALRAKKEADDEVGALVDSFNRVLATVEEQQGQLAEQHTRLARAKRLESLGLLAGGVAHDLNNILGPLVALPELVMEEVKLDDRGREIVGMMGKSARRASVVIRDLLALTRRGTYALGRVAIEELVEECVTGEVVTQRLKECGAGINVRLSSHRDEGDELLVEGSADHLVQVVTNLTINAAEAMHGEGDLWVRCGQRFLAKPLKGYETIPEGDYVVLTVEDNGTGISEDAMERLFEPFYTKKAMGTTSGTGLGLAVVYGVVRDHGGHINVRSKAGGGAIFDIYLKQYRETVERVGAEVTGAALTSAKVLVVDDYDQQRTLTRKLLEVLGHQVEQAASGREALQVLDGEKFDLMVVDMIMEDGFDGLDTIRGAMARQPGLRCIIATGFSETERVAEGMALGASACLNKPYTREALESAVAQAM